MESVVYKWFALQVPEIEKAHAWIQDHSKTCKELATGLVTYHFHGTPIGTKIEMACPCGEKCDITDYDSW